MSTSRAKQIAQKRVSKTKKKGNGAKYSYVKNKKMRKGPKHLWYDTSTSSKKRRR